MRRFALLLALAGAGWGGAVGDASAGGASPLPKPSAAPHFAAGAATGGAKLDAARVEDLKASLPLRKLRVFDPYERVEVEFEGFAARELLDRLLGPTWRKGDELLFSCLDGYRPSVPVARFLRHEALFAIRRVDQGEGFSLLKKDVSPARRAELGPFYLVWQNLSDRVIRAEGDYGWPYQLASVELVDFAARFPKLAPPAGASAAARRGFELYRVHCLKCHSINDEGGKTGPELNYPKSVTEYWRPGPLREWILDPSAFRFRSAMPGLPRELPERGRKVGDIVAYLSAMARRKIGPDPASSPR